jgi:outer membrane translocation and assembly module TamA
LEATQPTGIGGGNDGQVFAGLINDTRDYEPDPSRGGVEELTFRGSGAITLSHFHYTSASFVERRFWSLSSRLVFAQRVWLDALFGEVPYFELSDLGGLGAEGIGGASSVRGVPRDRYIGNYKALSNSELRWHITDFRLLKGTFKLGGVGFFDIGRVWQPDVDNGSFWLWHPGVGAGVRVVRRAAVFRMDYAVATQDGRSALYITFGHIF